MLKAILCFALGVLVGAFAASAYQERRPAAVPLAGTAGDPAAAPSRDWRLSREEIRDELQRTGEVVRKQARSAGEKIDDARIVTVIKAKYALDRDLSPFDIAVSASDGQVTLTGTVASEDLVGRAVGLALETFGVDHVIARLALKPIPEPKVTAGSGRGVQS